MRGPIFKDQADYLNFEDAILDSPETSVRNCHSALRNSPEERRNVTLFQNMTCARSSRLGCVVARDITGRT